MAFYIYTEISCTFARPANQLLSPANAACRMTYNSSRNAGTKLPGPRTFSLAAAFSAAISYIRSPDRTARSLSDGWVVRKQPATVPTAQPVYILVSTRMNGRVSWTYACHLAKKLVAIFDGQNPLAVTKVVGRAGQEDQVVCMRQHHGGWIRDQGTGGVRSLRARSRASLALDALSRLLGPLSTPRWVTPLLPETWRISPSLPLMRVK